MPAPEQPQHLRHVDIRTKDLDAAALTPSDAAALEGRACARCRSPKGLRPGGHAYTTSERAGRLGWPVKVCATCPTWGHQ
ncbi:hypothetical protein G3I57_13145 [Streptomyces albidoflavus]|uniref:hypothetical protein n=1 Tax=Streptomyces albidoflavus TaxID=1886 RepID=UPI0013D8ED8E|nr:hypothetical protein [Streptomyces albidoflavus]